MKRFVPAIITVCMCAAALFFILAGCRKAPAHASNVVPPLATPDATPTQSVTPQQRPLPANAPKPLVQMIEAAIDQTNYTTGYDASYVKLDYPGGDVPNETGVCTDVVVRAFRKAGVDLQKEVHEDMKANFRSYPKPWGLKKTDTNIDHRRVPNLMTFFERKGKSVGVTGNAADYQPGDIVSWDLGNSLTHIGIVTNFWSDETSRFAIVHNIGGGARIEDVLFSWKVTGHYRYF